MPSQPSNEPGAREMFDRVSDQPRDQWESLLTAELSAGADPAVVAQVRDLLGLVTIRRDSPTSPDSLAALRNHRAALERSIAMPSRIGPYELKSCLGEGGFAVVYEALQTHPVQRTVAIKVLKSGLHSDEMIRRFRQEQQSLAAMSHPNVAAVIDAGVSPEGWPYFVMEYVRGMPITRYCDERRLTLRQRLELFIPVCEAVQHAHLKGIIHRDLKPSNVLVADIDGRPTPKVIDFGIAKAMNQAQAEQEAFTTRGQIIGTPEYMSPEQAAPGQDVDALTDVYSLGVMLYEVLTGLLPFDPKALRSAAYGEIQRIIREVEPPTPSTRLTGIDGEHGARIAAARQVRREALTTELRRELEWIPLKAMRKDRARRYGSATALADDIGRYLKGQSLIAGPEAASYRAAKFVGRNKTAVLGAAGTLAAIVVGLGITLVALANARAAGEGERIAKERALIAGQKATSRFNDVLRLTSQAGDTAAMLTLIDQALEEHTGDEIELRLYKVAALAGNYKTREASEELARIEARPDLGKHRAMALLWRGDMELIGIVSVRTNSDPQQKIREALALGLPKAEAAYARGLIAEDFATARAAFDECVRADSGHVRGQLMLGFLDLLGGNLEAARARSAALAMRAPNDPSPLVLQALAMTLQGRFAETEPLLRRMEELCGAEQQGTFRWILQKFDEARPLLAEREQADVIKFVVPIATRAIALTTKSGPSNHIPLRMPAFVLKRAGLGDVLIVLTKLATTGNMTAAEDFVSNLSDSAPGLRPVVALMQAREKAAAGKFHEGEQVSAEALALPSLFELRYPLQRTMLLCDHQAYVKLGDLEAKGRGRAITEEIFRNWTPDNADDWRLARQIAECGDGTTARSMLEALEQRHKGNQKVLNPILVTRMVVESYDLNDSALLRYASRLPEMRSLTPFERTEAQKVLAQALARRGETPTVDGQPVDLNALRERFALPAPELPAPK